MAWKQRGSMAPNCLALIRMCLGGVSKKSQAVHQNAKPVAVKPYAYP